MMGIFGQQTNRGGVEPCARRLLGGRGRDHPGGERGALVENAWRFPGGMDGGAALRSQGSDREPPRGGALPRSAPVSITFNPSTRAPRPPPGTNRRHNQGRVGAKGDASPLGSASILDGTRCRKNPM
jgi:hypothetical protein